MLFFIDKYRLKLPLEAIIFNTPHNMKVLDEQLTYDIAFLWALQVIGIKMFLLGMTLEERSWGRMRSLSKVCYIMRYLVSKGDIMATGLVVARIMRTSAHHKTFLPCFMTIWPVAERPYRSRPKCWTDRWTNGRMDGRTDGQTDQTAVQLLVVKPESEGDQWGDRNLYNPISLIYGFIYDILCIIWYPTCGVSYDISDTTENTPCSLLAEIAEIVAFTTDGGEAAEP